MKYIYTAIFVPNEDGTKYYCRVPDLPGCITTGSNIDDAIEMITDARGIFVMADITTALTAEEATRLYEDFYRDAEFTHVSSRPVDLKQVVNTNKCVISLEKHGDKLLILCAIDNLLKGASGQAVHNMNLMFGLPEHTGLRLKPSAF